MIESYKKFWSNYVNFSGRTSRKDYWLTILCYLIVCFVVAFVVGLFIGLSGNESAMASSSNIGSVIGYLIGLIHSIGLLSMSIRRLHDVGKSGWWIFIGWVPIIGGIWLLVLYLSPSKN